MFPGTVRTQHLIFFEKGALSGSRDLLNFSSRRYALSQTSIVVVVAILLLLLLLLLFKPSCHYYIECLFRSLHCVGSRVLFLCIESSGDAVVTNENTRNERLT